MSSIMKNKLSLVSMYAYIYKYIYIILSFVQIISIIDGILI